MPQAFGSPDRARALNIKGDYVDCSANPTYGIFADYGRAW